MAIEQNIIVVNPESRTDLQKFVAQIGPTANWTSLSIDMEIWKLISM